MKLLVDVGVGKAVESWLEGQGFDVKAVRELNPRMTDRDILSLAVSESRIIITMDKDFGAMIFQSGMAHAGVLLLRLEEAPSTEKVRIVRDIVTQYRSSLSGNYCVYQNHRLRVRAT